VDTHCHTLMSTSSSHCDAQAHTAWGILEDGRRLLALMAVTGVVRLQGTEGSDTAGPGET
jgi:hypothetical protein